MYRILGMKRDSDSKSHFTSSRVNLLRNRFVILISFVLTLSPTAIFADKNDIVRIAMSATPLSSPFIIAQQKGFFKELGINVEIKQVKGGHLSLNAVLAGEADIATSSEAVVMFNSFKRSDFSVFCTFVTSDNDVKIIARSDSGINSINALKGKKVGTILGTSAHFFLSYTLLMNGVSEDGITISNFKPHESIKLLKNKKLDAVVMWEPYAYLAQKELGNKVKVINHDRVYVETFNAISMREYANKNPDKLSAIIQALINATDYIKQHSEESQKIVAEVLAKDLSLVKTTWPDFSFSVGLNQWLLTSMENEARWAIKHEFLKVEEIPNYINFINRKPLNKVAPQRITIF